MRNRFAAMSSGFACLIAGSAFADETKPVVEFFATGGTIAMKIDPIKHAPVPAISGEDLLATVPEVNKYARVEVNNLSNVPSDYMDPPRWIALTRAVEAALARPEVAGAIISHGTDTLEETAWWLDLTVDFPSRLCSSALSASPPSRTSTGRVTCSTRCELLWMRPQRAWA